MISSSEVFTTAEITTVVRRSNRKTQRMTLKLGKDCYPNEGHGGWFYVFFRCLFLGFGVSGWGFEGEGCFLWWFCLDVFFGLMDEQEGVLVVGVRGFCLASPKFCRYDTVFLRGTKSIFKSSSCLCIWPRLVKLEYKRFSKKWKNNRCQVPFSTLPNLKRVCLVKDWSSGTSTMIILDVWTVFGATATKIVGRDRSKFILSLVHEPTISTSGKPPSFGRFFKTNYCRIGQLRE